MPVDDSSPPVNLETLAQDRFGALRQAEIELLHAATKGEEAWCGPSKKDDDPGNDPAQAALWSPEREIRAGLIRWLCVDKKAASAVDPRGIQVYAARIAGPLDLAFVTVPFPLYLWRCRFTDNITLTSAHLPGLGLSGSRVPSLDADGVTVAADIFLDNAFRAEDEVRLLGAQIGGNLECGGGTFENNREDGIALYADGANVKGSVFLRSGFTAEGEVRLLSAEIGATLDCAHGTFNNPGKDALSVDGAVVTGDVFLRCGFVARGRVRLPGVQIGGDLNCLTGRFTEVNLLSATIKGNLIWRDIRAAAGTRLDVTSAKAGSVADDRLSWPDPGNLFLDGFAYDRISQGPTDAQSRLDWLGRQEPFRPQPYSQLAKVLRGAGDDDGALSVLFKKEIRRRQVPGRSSPAQLWNWALRSSIGYGFYPGRAIWGVLLVTLVGSVLFGLGYFGGAMAPTEKEAYTDFHATGHRPAHYQSFNALIYSLENSLPLVKLGQSDAWAPEPNPPPRAHPALEWGLLARIANAKVAGVSLGDLAPPPALLQWFRWFQVLLGWALATLFTAGVTGLVRKE